MKTREDVIEAVLTLRDSCPHLYLDDVVATLSPKMDGVSPSDFIAGVREALKRTDNEAQTTRGRNQVMACLGIDEFPPVRKRGSGQRAHYEITFRDTDINLGTAAELLVPTKVEAAFLAAVDWTPNLPPRAQWRSCASAIAQAAEKIPTGTEAEETAEWISLFVQGREGRGIGTKSAQWHHLEAYGVLEIDGILYINTTRMAKDLLITHGVRVSRDELCQRFSRLGFERQKLCFRLEEGIKTMHTWYAPVDFDPDAIYTGEVGEPMSDDPDRFKKGLTSSQQVQ